MRQDCPLCGGQYSHKTGLCYDPAHLVTGHRMIPPDFPVLGRPGHEEGVGGRGPGADIALSGGPESGCSRFP